MREHFRLALIMIALIALIPETARAGCWKPDQARAAKIRAMEAMLTTAARRCRAGDTALAERYDRFIASNRPALADARAALRARFADSVGAAAASRDYDAFVEGIARYYDARLANQDCGAVTDIVLETATERASVETLAKLADRAGIAPVLDAPVCQMRVAVLTH